VRGGLLLVQREVGGMRTRRGLSDGVAVARGLLDWGALVWVVSAASLSFFGGGLDSEDGEGAVSEILV
jgi:hypothetical protein